ncbi:MAG: hypothetical protein KGD65_10360 [Candidatus Lokiarchaeota archaeon]|nr:hypothetical protein [Candidatus Lokiarchaeota archaeon]
MSSANTIKKNVSQKIEDKTIKFQDAEEILFPKVCIICGVTTENQYKQNTYGSFIPNKEYKKDYSCNLPICNECVDKVKMKTGISSKSGQLLLISGIIGLILAIYFYILTYSIFLSISIFTTSIILPYLYYLKKTKSKINLDEFLEVTLSDYSETLIFNFLNPLYANYIKDSNTKNEAVEDAQKEPEEFEKSSETNSELLDAGKKEE